VAASLRERLSLASAMSLEDHRSAVVAAQRSMAAVHERVAELTAANAELRR
jgi:hypothetical protein